MLVKNSSPLVRSDWKKLSSTEKVEAVAAMPAKMTAPEIAAQFENCGKSAIIGLWNRNRHIFPRRRGEKSGEVVPASKHVRPCKPKPAGWRGMTSVQKIEALVALPDYFTASQCAEALQAGSPQSIRQFWHRNRHSFPKDRQHPAKGRPNKGRRAKPTEFVKQAKAPSGFQPRPTPLAPNAPSGGMAYLDARECHCAFPLWGPEVTRIQDKRVCGAPVEPGKKGSGARYCTVHAEFATQRRGGGHG
ncbi:MAG: hypothetical protein AAF903_12365 [Pseudomonadota bacterium]